MFVYHRKPFIIPQMSKYLNDYTNKSLEKYLRKSQNQLINIKELSPNNSNFGIRVSDLVLQKKDPPSIYFFLPIVVCISFLAGYNFSKLTN